MWNLHLSTKQGEIKETYYEEKPNNGQELKIWHEQ